MQRLFSTFANGWPGKGLLLLRLALAAYLLSGSLSGLDESAAFAHRIPRILGAVVSVLVLAGRWTPMAGVAAAVTVIWAAQLEAGLNWAAILGVAIALALALLGPGAYSLDALAYGRKRILAGHS